ncbi:hypothetical protein [Streptomyces sp. NPDC051310]|uniref:hypothetical protein n=1 Tax=Streptomyces sp. NPDC051310 TaxID=3365649 RepID=UPI0037977FFF
MTAADLSRLDVPAERVAAEALLRDARAHSHSPSDRIAYALDVYLVTHPDAPVSTESGDPEWDAWLAHRIDECKATRSAARNETAGGTT